MDFHSLMDQLVHVSTYGVLLQLFILMMITLGEVQTAPVLTSMRLEHIQYLHLSVMSTSVILATLLEYAFYPDNPLWDGAGCPSTSTCCQLNTPPYFCKALSQPTSEDIEIRIILNEGLANEDVIVSMIDIYVQ